MHLIVIDANVWIKFARSKDIAPVAIRLFEYNFVPVVNQYLFTEIFEAITENKWMTDKQAENLLLLLRQVCYFTTETSVYRLSPDPKDNYLFDLAIQTKSEVIVSDEKKLLGFKESPVLIKSLGWFKETFPVAL